jgi:hypothetical protein
VELLEQQVVLPAPGDGEIARRVAELYEPVALEYGLGADVLRDRAGFEPVKSFLIESRR